MGVGMQETFEKVLLHDEEIEKLKFNDKQHDDRIKALEDQSIKLENTVMSENRDTRQTFVQYSNKISQQNEDLLDIVRSALGMKATTDTQLHEFRMAKWNTVSSIFLKISGALVAALGSGGILYLAFQKFVVEK